MVSSSAAADITNGDGIDVDSCSGVTIENCDINTGDDAISLKSGRGLAAMRLRPPDAKCPHQGLLAGEQH